MTKTELMKAFNDFEYKAILMYESICEQLVIDNFSSEEAIKIQTLVLDRAQAIWEEITQYNAIIES